MIMIVEQSVEWELAEETEVVGEKPPQFNFVHHKSHMTLTELEPGWEAGHWPLTAWAMARPQITTSKLRMTQAQWMHLWIRDGPRVAYTMKRRGRWIMWDLHFSLR
jgi:hypothetical protein